MKNLNLKKKFWTMLIHFGLAVGSYIVNIYKNKYSIVFSNIKIYIDMSEELYCLDFLLSLN